MERCGTLLNANCMYNCGQMDSAAGQRIQKTFGEGVHMPEDSLPLPSPCIDAELMASIADAVLKIQVCENLKRPARHCGGS